MLVPQFSKKLEAALKQRGLSQVAFAELAGVTPTHISRVKRGGDDIPEVFLKKICAALGITVAAFIGAIDSADSADCFEKLQAAQQEIARLNEENQRLQTELTKFQGQLLGMQKAYESILERTTTLGGKTQPLPE